ncbi:MAG: hypothetical protein HC871_12910 [Rhizobiales bacterium]|nr:hypothetical protein [Hyphomicrobiales bacterium]
MSKGGKAPKAAKSTQIIGDDPLSQGLMNLLRSQSQQGPGIGQATQNAARQIAGSTDALGLTDPSVDLLRQTIAGKFLDPAAMAGQVEAAAAPALRQFQRSISPNIAGRFAASGRLGSADRPTCPHPPSGVSSTC